MIKYPNNTQMPIFQIKEQMQVNFLVKKLLPSRSQLLVLEFVILKKIL